MLLFWWLVWLQVLYELEEHELYNRVNYQDEEEDK